MNTIPKEQRQQCSVCGSVHRSQKAVNECLKNSSALQGANDGLSALAAPPPIDTDDDGGSDDPDTADDGIKDMPQQHRIPAENVEAFMNQIDKANRRLERAGIADRFAVEMETEWEHYTLPTGVAAAREWATMTLNYPRLSYGDWEFTASLDREEGGMMVHRKPGGASLEGWERPDEHMCEYCGKKIRRVKSYVLTNPKTGEIKQVGSNCISLFLGVEPKGLWALQWTPEELEEMTSELGGEGGGGKRTPSAYKAKNLIALALVATKGNGENGEYGDNFVSGRTAYIYDGMTSTNQQVHEILYRAHSPYYKDAEGKAEAMRMIREAAELENDPIIDQVLNARLDVKPGDYRDNLDVVADSEYVGSKSSGTLVSLISVWNRQRDMERKKKAQSPVLNEYLADVGDKIGTGKGKTHGESLKSVKVLGMREFDGYAYNSTDTRVRLQDSDGRILTWKASNKTISDLEEQGMKFDPYDPVRVEITGATIKGHKTWDKSDGESEKQTDLSRVKWKALDPEDD